MTDVFRKLRKTEAKLESRVRGLVRRAVLKSLSEAGLQVLKVDTYAGPQTVELVQNYGFASKPLAGAEAVVVGDSVMFAVACDDASKRPDDLAAGESAQYGPNTGQIMTCKADGSIVIEPMAGQVVKVGVAATDAVVTADKLHAFLTAWIASTATVAQDGGAALKSSLSAYLGLNPASTFSATKLDAE